MIDPKQRLFCPDGSLGFEPDELSRWNFVDYDTRKWVVFEGLTDPFGYDDGEKATEALLPVLDKSPISRNVTKISFMADGKQWTATDSPEDDVTPVVNYPKFGKAEVGHFAEKTIKRGSWVEIDRIGPRLDLIDVRHTNTEGIFVFKYNIVPRPRPERSLWRSAFIHLAVSNLPGVVPFGDFVVHETTGQFVGYTTKYFPGGSLNKRSLSLFKRKWIHQLTDLVDHLNKKYGIMHQDIVPRNMVLHDQQDRVLLFDFDFAALIGSQDILPFCEDGADLCFAIYEILTGDRHFDRERRTRQVQSIMSLDKHWPLKDGMKLEHGVTTESIKSELETWLKNRRKFEPAKKSELRSSVVIPEMQISQIMEAQPNDDGTLWPASYAAYADPKAHIIRWERPASAQQKLRRSPRHQP